MSILGDQISGHDYGVYLNDYAAPGPSTSIYDVTIRSSDLAGNAVAVQNDYAGTTIDAQFNWWGSSSGPALGAVLGNIDYAHVLLASALSDDNLVFVSGSVVLTVNVPTGEFALYEDGVLVTSGTGARVQNGKLKLHEKTDSGKLDAVGDADGMVKFTLKTGNSKNWKSASLNYVALDELLFV